MVNTLYMRLSFLAVSCVYILNSFIVASKFSLEMLSSFTVLHKEAVKNYGIVIIHNISYNCKTINLLVVVIKL